MKKYRPNVGIVVFNKDSKVLMCARADKADYQWQFPQGGIDAKEDVIAAAKRELREETGITSVELVAKTAKPIRYDFPDAITEKFAKDCPYVGQEQSWVLFYLYGDESEIDFCTHPEEIEFKAYEWVDIAEAPRRIVYFKKAVYEEVAATFASYIEGFGK